MTHGEAGSSGARVPVVLFDDGGGLLSPLTDLRPSFAVRTGVFSLLERVKAAGWSVAGVVVPERLEALAREQFDVPVNADVDPRGDLFAGGGGVAVNGRCVLVPEGAAALGVGEALVEAGSGDVVAARVEGDGLAALVRGERPGVKTIAELPAPALLSRPWHVKTFRDRAIVFDMQFAPAQHQFAMPAAVTGGTPAPRDFTIVTGGTPAPRNETVTGGTPVPRPLSVHPTARLCPGCIVDLEQGPVWIDAGAVVRPGATVMGPCYVGARSTVMDHALIKANTAIGPSCKVGGEVGGTIFQGCANKAHEGHLGDSWVGQWANLGAGTTNSNLLNTYGEVIAYATPKGSPERTAEQFLGSIIGDHARFAILTRLMTGAIVGTGVMWAAGSPVTGHVRSFAWVTDAGERVYRLDKFLDVARTVMGRRAVEVSGAYEAVVRLLARTS